MLHQEIKDGIKEALKSKDTVRLSVLRGLTAAFTNELVAKKRKPDEMLTDEEALAVITRQAKQRKDSIDQFTKGDRADLAASEQAELTIIESYLPTMMDETEITKLVEQKKMELGINDKSQSGQLMFELMKDLKGKADGALVKKVVDKLF